MKTITGAVLATALVLPLAAEATPNRTASGSYGGLSWSAVSRIVGQTSTATIAGGGDSIYLPSQPQKSGTVQLLMEYGDLGSFVCSGSLASDRRSIVTAAHCVSGGERDPTFNPTRVTAFFFDGDPDEVVLGNPLATAIDVTNIFVSPEYSGQVIDQNDIAVLRLAEFAPDFATAYGLYTAGDLTGVDFNVAGYGGRSDTGGAVGANLGTGRLREGDNMYDFALGDDEWGGIFEAVFAGQGELELSFVSDFDNGLVANDASCQLSIALETGAGFCDLGLGLREVGIAGGDSGGPGFVAGLLASVNSYSLSFGADFGDVDLFLNSSWGEYSGYVPIYIHADWISSVLFNGAIPEPGTWAMMIAGFGLVGGSLRRRGVRAVAA